MLAKDIMHKGVVTVEPYLTVSELAKIFTERCISGAPVVDGEGNILGVVSQTDLVRSRREASSGVPVYHVQAHEVASSVGMHLEEIAGERVENIMTPGAISFDENTLVEDLAASMIELHIHRVLITRKGRLCGIVTSMDMLHALLPAAKRRLPGAARRH